MRSSTYGILLILSVALEYFVHMRQQKQQIKAARASADDPMLDRKENVL